MKIFIQIASYRDPELIPTLNSCIENSKYPENLVFSIARQFHPDDKFDDLSEFDNDERFKVINIPHEESKGVCWARNLTQQQYDGEEYTLQIDSHMRFEKDWDETLIGMVKQLQEIGIPKPLLTSYVPSYNPSNDPDGRVRVPWRMAFDKFIPEGAVFFLPETIPDWEEIEMPVPSRFYSAHFCFTLGEFSNEVQHNPEYYFHGEEISIGVRAFTHGYDLFHPHRVVVWHEYTRNGRTKQWDDDKEWYKKNESSHLTNRKLFAMDGLAQEGHEGPYGFGNVRSLRDYEIYSGLLFEKRSVQDYTLQKNYPPNPYEYENEEDWKESFVKDFDYCIKVDRTKLQENDYEFWVVAFHREGGETIYRKDADENEIKRVISEEPQIYEICRTFKTAEKPNHYVLWPYSKSKGWCDKIEVKIN
jgi:glycosyltransferase involved in cell wall biosynthesis